MYNANRTNIYFGGELDKFIKIAKNHARKEKTIDFQGRGGGGVTASGNTFAGAR